VESHSAEEIRLANLARKQLEKKEGPKEKRAGKKWPLIKDERAVTRPATPFILFAVNRHASGDFKHIAVTERLRLISREWKELSESEKEVCLCIEASPPSDANVLGRNTNRLLLRTALATKKSTAIFTNMLLQARSQQL
jgi:hypothetical protein